MRKRYSLGLYGSIIKLKLANKNLVLQFSI